MFGCESQHIVTISANNRAVRFLHTTLRMSEAPRSEHAATVDTDMDGACLRRIMMKREPDDSNGGQCRASETDDGARQVPRSRLVIEFLSRTHLRLAVALTIELRSTVEQHAGTPERDQSTSGKAPSKPVSTTD